LEISHTEGRLVFDEYFERMKHELLRVIELVRWQKTS